VDADNVWFLNRSSDIQAHAEHPASVNKVPARTADVGGGALAAKQQAAGSENGLEELEKEEVENISFQVKSAIKGAGSCIRRSYFSETCNKEHPTSLSVQNLDP
jgi:hypothetical protein